jgi:membrane fusion protein
LSASVSGGRVAVGARNHRLHLRALAYNLAAFLRRIELPEAMTNDPTLDSRPFRTAREGATDDEIFADRGRMLAQDQFFRPAAAGESRQVPASAEEVPGEEPPLELTEVIAPRRPPQQAAARAPAASPPASQAADTLPPLLPRETAVSATVAMLDRQQEAAPIASQRSLFRREAIEFQQQHRQWGEVAVIQPLPVKLTSWFLVGCVALIFTLLLVTEYARKETAAGYLTPISGTARIYAPEAGTITAVHVTDGERAAAGQSLLTVATARFTSEDKSVETVVRETLTAQRERLSRRIAAQEEVSSSEAARLSDLIEGLDAELKHLEAQADVQDELIVMSGTSLASAVRLASLGHMSGEEQRRRREAHLQQQQAKTELERRAAELRRERAMARHALQRLPFTMEEQLQTYRNDLAIAEQQLAQARGREGYTIVAPIDGRITTLQARVGQTADPQHLQMEIFADNDMLEARLFVPARAIGFLEIGQQVRLLYEAFPYQSYGVYGGTVSNISRTIVTQKDVTIPVTLVEPSYVVSVSLERPDVEAYGQSIPLQPDMLLSADIILDKRSLIEWLLEPLLRSGR